MNTLRRESGRCWMPQHRAAGQAFAPSASNPVPRTQTHIGAGRGQMLYRMWQRLFGTPNSLRVLAELVSGVQPLTGAPLL